MSLKDKMKYGYTYLIYPASINGTPLKVSFMEKLDENDVGTGKYYSFAELSAELGRAFIPMPYINENFLLVHLPLGLGENAQGDNDHKELNKELKKLLKSNMRDGIKKEGEVDFANLDPESYGFFNAHEVLAVPKNVTVEPVI